MTLAHRRAPEEGTKEWLIAHKHGDGCPIGECPDGQASWGCLSSSSAVYRDASVSTGRCDRVGTADVDLEAGVPQSLNRFLPVTGIN
ncbi:hypothetical protein MGALJ_19630 [Mycobacterium gallinarum]|uniref:Uncharacterized protein n=1 Tax=Mycobacterium gallinarum TaxID=39689 RepID=A0A9W4BH65_9MYCO|nr:hypothetical protein MGALJ_19630 [Mycobacterium gallinarum]